MLDFEDLMIGSPLQDVAITLYYGRTHADYAALAAAFEEGYHSVRPWPAPSLYELETLIAGRTLMFINYVAYNSSQPLKHIEPMCDRLAAFLQKWK
ncbi:MAG: phosphotransferase [Caldilineaceae bacterium]